MQVGIKKVSAIAQVDSFDWMWYCNYNVKLVRDASFWMGTNCYRSAPILSRIHIICLHSFILFNVHSVHSVYLRFGQVFLHVYLSFHLPHHFRYYHEKKHFYRLLCMLSNEVVERAKSLVNHNVLDKLDEVSKC